MALVLPNQFQQFAHAAQTGPSPMLSTTPKQSKYFTELIPQISTVPTSVSLEPIGINEVDSQFRLHWERARALSLGICDFVGSEINGMRMYSVTRLARIYGNQNSNAFAKQWSVIKSDFQNCSEFRVFQRKGEDHISKEVFDQAVLPFLKDSCVDLLYTEFRKSREPQAAPQQPAEPVQASPALLSPPSQSHYAIRTSAAVNPPPPWEIKRDIWTRHDGILSQMRRSRGCYIGQISQREYKFGYTDKGFMTRTDKHTKDFKDFYLCFAKYCANGYEAERLFKSDPYVKAHLIKVKTQKQNHREIVRLNSTVTEQRIKDIYLKCIKIVNEQELKNLLAAMNEQDEGTMSEDFTTDSQDLGDTIISSEEPAIEVQEELAISSTTSELSESDLEVDEIHHSNAVELKRLDLEILQENHRHEIQLRLLDQQGWLAFLNAQSNSDKVGFPVVTAVTENIEREHQVLEASISQSPEIRPKRKSTRLGSSPKTILKIKAQNGFIAARFSSLEQAVQSGKSYNFQKLQMAVKKGTIYKGYRWSYATGSTKTQ